MKRLVSLVVAVGLLVGIAAPASAHFLITDGNIGMILHVDPNDDPEVGGNSTFYLDFKDKTNRFSLNDCNCEFSLTKDGQQVYQSYMDQPASALSYILRYEFPAKGIYHVTVTGSPDKAGQFDSFKMEYDVRVARDNGQAPTNSGIPVWVYIMWAAVLSAIAAGAVVYLRRPRKGKGSKKD